ncbi:transglycosylase SLT domain-containing protein [Candidatus Igneacidithiobacillus taiwanensis]|uniref:lytic transglycosylase domain-containing protein n=1 Tax=Candidatus Igneacidithiobacillus taiwanensis TaxID=1945924 RepID=UPI00289F5633|nr:transglycosylase SLT domain-containing protein [Candidatus Igneacidithiobacillus taiwanensis]
MAASQAKLTPMRSLRGLAAALFLVSVAAQAALSPQQEQALQNAAQSFSQGQYQAAAAALPLLANTYMGPWVAYWSLQPRLTTLTNAQFEQFAAEFPHGAAYRLLRRQWLLQLGKRQDWQNFAKVYRNGPAPQGIDLRCYAAMNPLLQVGSPAQLWSAAPAGSKACNQMAASALTQGRIPQALLWHKLAQMMVERDFRQASALAQFLPGAAAAAVQAIGQSGSAWLAANGSTATQVYGEQTGAELVHLALLRLTTSQPADAVAQAQTQPGLTSAQRASVYYAAGWRAARQLQSTEASAWFAKAVRTDPSYIAAPRMLHWMVRAALLQGNWSLVLAAVERLPKDEASASQWQFWKALALQQSGQNSQAQQIWARIASPFDAYGQLASAAIGSSLRLPPPESISAVFSSDPPETVSAANGVDADDLRRAFKLYQLGLYFDALWEWGQALDQRSPAAIRAAARQAAAHQAWLLTINASTHVANDEDWQQGYVLPYRNDILAAASNYGLAPSFVAGVIRQESGFAPGISSSAGAQGIMQVMPATANWVQQHYPQTASADLQEASGNIRIGTAYLAYLRRQFGDSPLLLAAAYNAGPGAVNHWLRKIPVGGSPWAGAIFAANIPYQQTRDYVLAVLSNAIVYRAILGEGAVSPLHYWKLS